MMDKTSKYNQSVTKILLNYSHSLGALILTTPLFLLIIILSKIFNSGPVFFIQKRVGKNGKIFKMIKFRTMVVGAEKLKSKYKYLNHADGPVFKIKNDPRLTKFGGVLVKTGLDELPQLINVLKGEMNLVGPRPLPVSEARKLTKKQKVRELVKPGITSSWVTSGAHNLKFSKWMKLDKEYVQYGNLQTDIRIISQTFIMIVGLFLRKLTCSPNQSKTKKKVLKNY